MLDYRETTVVLKLLNNKFAGTYSVRQYVTPLQQNHPVACIGVCLHARCCSLLFITTVSFSIHLMYPIITSFHCPFFCARWYGCVKCTMQNSWYALLLCCIAWLFIWRYFFERFRPTLGASSPLYNKQLGRGWSTSKHNCLVSCLLG